MIPVVEELVEKAEAAIRSMDSPAWRSDPRAQFEMARFLRGLTVETIPVEVARRLHAAARVSFAQIPSQSAERWDRLLALKSEEDVWRAIKFQGVDATRMPGEEIYPDDGWIGAYLRWVNESEVPLGYHFWAAISALGAAAKRNVYLDRGSFFLYPAMAILLVGPPGVRKSQAINTAVAVVEAMNDRVSDEWLEELEREPQIVYERDPRIRLMPHDCSFLALLKSLRGTRKVYLNERPIVLNGYQESTGFLALRELGSLLNKDTFAVGKTIDTLIDLADAPGQVRYSSEKQGAMVIRDAALMLIAATTPTWMQENMGARFFGGGLASRMLFIYREDSGGRINATPATLDPIARDALAEHLAGLVRLPKTPLELSAEATRFFNSWYRDNHKIVEAAHTDERLRGYYRRKDGHLLRLAMLLSLSLTERQEVTASNLEHALEILDHEERTMLECFASVERHPDAPNLDVIAERLRVHGGRMSHARLMRNVYGRQGIGPRFGALMEALVAMGRVERTKAPEGESGVWYALLEKDDA